MKLRNKIGGLFQLVTFVAAMTLVSFASRSLASGTSVGDGGDPVFQFLEAARYSFRQTVAYLEAHAEAQTQFCNALERLTSDQRKDCREFAIEVIPQLLQLNAPTGPTPFVLREKPLIVDDADGKPMQVAARTLVGPSGPIEFHHASVEFMSPRQILFLIAHEFGHKVQSRGRWVFDNKPLASFPSGRMLLDSVAEEFVALAIRQGFIGTSFGLLDIFECRADSANHGPIQREHKPAMRRFAGRTHDRYTVTIGNERTDAEFNVPELGNTELRFRLRIREEKGCLTPATPQERGTSLEVWRFFPQIGQLARDPELVAQQELPGFNPICQKSSLTNLSGNLTWMIIDAAGIRFSCRYAGSQSQTYSTYQD